MDKCQITFKENEQNIIVDFTVDDNGNADYNVKMDPEIKDKDTNLGLAGFLCQMFLEAVHRNGSPEEVESDTN